MSIGKHMIEKQVLSVEQAHLVFADLEQLETTGVWDTPQWATELSDHMDAATAAHPAVIMVAWKAVAMAYRDARG
jgi:hypothetical protein